ncbi:MAG: metal-sulfur cluster assembly factor [Pirellulaceae bacterium]
MDRDKALSDRETSFLGNSEAFMMNDEQSAPDPDSSSQDSASEEPTSDSISDEQQLPPGAAAGTLGEDRVREELKKVIDPELFVNIVDLGLIYEVAISDADDGQKNIAIEMTLTSPMCPAGPQLIGQSKQVLTQLENVADVEVKVVMDPPWTPEKMTDDARDQLGIF